MKIVVASDSFKGSLTSLEVANAIKKGINRFDKSIEVVEYGLADGGEGSMETLVEFFNGSYKKVEVLDPLNRKIMSSFGILDEESVIIEMASASGLTLLKDSELDAFKTTTYGVGQLIDAAVKLGYKKIYVGLGGSATNDGGVGMAMALGVLFYDQDNKLIGFGNKELSKINKIDISNINPLITDAEFILLSDVNNLLYGKDGASEVFGPQKGATKKDIKRLDDNLKHYSDKLVECLNIDVRKTKGAGAAGGLGAGLIAFCNAKVFSGVDKILEKINIEDDLKSADLLITGEGKIDGQTIYGKAPVGVAKLAKQHDLFVLAIVGSVGSNAGKVFDHGIDMIVDIISQPMTFVDAIDNAANLVEEAAFSAISSIINSEILDID